MKRIFLLLCICTFFFNCSTESNSDDQELQEDNFYALTVGNSWVYKKYRYNSTNETYDNSGIIDSVSIVGTELISGQNYFKFRTKTTGETNNNIFPGENGESFEFLRDSTGYLIDDSGTIKFTNNDFSELLVREENWGTVFHQLNTDSIVKEVEAGNFECLEMERWAIITSTGLTSPGRQNTLYSDGIGLIFKTISFVVEPIPPGEIRLDSFNVQ